MFLEEVTIAEALKSAGYKKALFGKWHLGADLERGPTKQGFDVILEYVEVLSINTIIMLSKKKAFTTFTKVRKRFL